MNKMYTKGTDEDFVLSKYLNDLSSIEYRKLTPEEEKKISDRIKDGDREAEKKLILSNLRFVINVAKNYQNQGVALSDLINIGNMGLIKAARKFDGKKNFKFVSYAVWWIRQAILQAISDQSRITKIPLNRTARLYKIRKAISKLEQKKSSSPTIEEIAEEIGESIESVSLDMNTDSVAMSLDKSIQDSNNTFMDVIADNRFEGSDSITEKSTNIEAIQKALEILPEKYRKVLLMYKGFLNGHQYTLEEIGQEVGCTRERVRQIKNNAIKKLRADYRARSILKSML